MCRGAGKPAPRFLPDYAQRQLNRAREICLAGDGCERRARGRQARRIELGVIERIEELAAELDLDLLLQRHVLNHREVQVLYAIGAERAELRGEYAQVVGK